MAYDLDFIRDIFRKANVPIDRDDVWDVQSVRVVKHKALERLAAGMSINFDAPQILRCEADEAVILATGRMGDKSEWSIGEAKVVLLSVDTGRKNKYGKPIYEAELGAFGNYQITPKQASYPFAMAEKRAKDRVILKLAGLHGVYSEDEADDFKQSNQTPELKYKESAVDEIAGYVAHCKTGILNHTQRDELVAYWKQEADNRATLRLKPGIPEYDALYEAYKARGKAISSIVREAAE